MQVTYPGQDAATHLAPELLALGGLMGLSEDAQETVRGFRDTLILWRISEESPAGGRDGGMVHSEIAQFACRCVRSLASRQKLFFDDNNRRKARLVECGQKLSPLWATSGARTALTR